VRARRAARNTLKNSLRAAKHLALPDEAAAEFAAHEAARLAELARAAAHCSRSPPGAS
jgi:hypothetical protein